MGLLRWFSLAALAYRLRRRGEGDLVLTTAHRYEQEHAVVRPSVRVLTELIRLGQTDLVRRMTHDVMIVSSRHAVEGQWMSATSRRQLRWRAAGIA
ncbi:hypothetical protein [Actinoplanes sp. DH11]|uniref:hypothetical protein n=1 Tax=Actinoplanes sp. DH11 TaxID=2857011 RepID=UPI001E301D60|nr:hypothetical protein [Actinoplanes sp. DH11]